MKCYKWEYQTVILKPLHTRESLRLKLVVSKMWLNGDSLFCRRIVPGNVYPEAA